MKLKHIFMPVLYVEECYFFLFLLIKNSWGTKHTNLSIKYVISYLCCKILDGVGKPTLFCILV